MIYLLNWLLALKAIQALFLECIQIANETILWTLSIIKTIELNILNYIILYDKDYL